jgi:hypothetical protein
MDIKKIIRGEKIPSKLSAQMEAERIKKKIIGGKVSALPFYIAKSYVEEFFSHLLDEEVKDMAIDEIKKYGGDGFQFNGARVKYHYRHDYDYYTTKELCDIDKEIEKLEKKKREIIKAAKWMPKDVASTVITTEDGEHIEIQKPRLEKATLIVTTELPLH